MKSDISYNSRKGKRIGNHTNASAIQLEAAPSVLQKLLAASKDAEVLIACLAEQHLLTAAPLIQIWENLAAAIEDAQASLRAQTSDVPESAIYPEIPGKETLDASLSTNHVRVLCGTDAGRHWHRRMVLQEKKG
jgi:hypothetical protein